MPESIDNFLAPLRRDIVLGALNFQENEPILDEIIKGVVAAGNIEITEESVRELASATKSTLDELNNDLGGRKLSTTSTDVDNIMNDSKLSLLEKNEELRKINTRILSYQLTNSRN